MIKESGYYFHQRVHPHAPGHPQLDITLRVKPTLKHFDPELVTLAIFDNHNNVVELQLCHPWNGQKTYRIAPGRIMIQDRKRKIHAAFSFGGTLSIDSTGERTHCTITSAAPILELIEEDAIACLLAAEVEATLAQRRASLAPEIDQFVQRLAEVDVWQFYLICLCSLKSKFATSPRTLTAKPAWISRNFWGQNCAGCGVRASARLNSLI